jgi:hypothetical protein
MHRHKSASHRRHRDHNRIGAVLQFYSDWCDETSEDGKFSCLLKTAIELESSKIEDLMATTSLPRNLVALVHARMERSGIWADGNVDLKEFLTCSRENLPFLCLFHLVVAKGEIVRTEERTNGQYAYQGMAIPVAPANKSSIS